MVLVEIMRLSTLSTRHCSRQAFALVEVAVAVAVVGLFLSMLMVISSNLLGLLRTAKDDISASQALQERVEMMRIANWLQITDANYISTKLLASGTSSAQSLADRVETITVTAYRASGTEPTISTEVIRQNRVNKITKSNIALKDERMVRVDITLTWKGFPKHRQRHRATTSVIAKGGITK